MGDAVCCAIPGQEPPQGCYNISEMLLRVLSCRGRLAACASCMRTRSPRMVSLVKGVEEGSVALLSEWTTDCGAVHSF
ncbi:MAG: hypothetical protein QXJ32_01375 [Thermoplasmata archaeon]